MTLEYRHRGRLVLEADAPGLDPEREIAVSVSDGVLHVRARRGDGARPADATNDLRGGELSRDLALPAGCGPVSAEYDGLRLFVRVRLRGAVAPGGAVPIVAAPSP